jgi:hypothetical protein
MKYSNPHLIEPILKNLIQIWIATIMFEYILNIMVKNLKEEEIMKNELDKSN